MAKGPKLWRRARGLAARVSLRQMLASPLVFLALGLARATALTLPFRLYAPLLGEDWSQSAPAAAPVQPAGRSAGRRAARIGRLIETVARTTPWDSNCLAQAIVAALCLRLLSINYTVHLGVAPSAVGTQAIEAHAWVMASGYPVTGYRESLGMTCVRTFGRQFVARRRG